VDQEIEYEQFAEPGTTSPQGEVDLSRVSDIPMELSVEIGRTQMTVGETLSLRAGTIVTLDRLAGEPVDLLVNGTPIARGEVVVVDEKFGLRVKEILEGGDAAAIASHGEPGLASGEDGSFGAGSLDAEIASGAMGAGGAATTAAAGASTPMAAATGRTPGVIAGPPAAVGQPAAVGRPAAVGQPAAAHPTAAAQPATAAQPAAAGAGAEIATGAGAAVSNASPIGGPAGATL
jgi:flagellar motor switch protein FliN/FliY